MKHMLYRSTWLRTAAVLPLLLMLSGGRLPAQTVVPPEDITYILPMYLQYQSVSDEAFSAEIEKLRSRIGPEGPYVRIGFAIYINILMDDWSVDINDPTAVRAALADTIAQMDSVIAKANRAGVPVCLSFLTKIRGSYDNVQTAAEQADVRNTQWFGGQDASVDNTISFGWMTHSRYARHLRQVQEAYIRELGKVLANRIQQYPDIVVAAAGDGEVELSYEQSPLAGKFTMDTMHLADYSPFAVTEFRDWLKGGGLYATGQAFAGQAYALAARYVGDATPGSDDNGDGHTLNGDFGTSFTNWNLRYFDWSLSDEGGSAIPYTTYSASGFDRHPASNAGGFDAPRVRAWTNSWWQLWLEFRRQMILRHNVDFSKWMTTSADSGPGSGGTGATVPTARWYSYQIPADRLYGLSPDDPNNLRYETSASAWWTGDVTPYGRLGTTSFNLYYGPPPGPGPACGSSDPKINYFCRTLAGLAPQIAQRNLHFGLLEWHPGVGDQSLFPADSDVYGEEMKILEQYRPSLLVPFALGISDPQYPFYDSRFETSLKALVARLNSGAAADPDPRLAVDGPMNNAIVPQPFIVSGWAIDLATIRGSGWGPGIDRIEVYATRSGGTETLIGTAAYGTTRADVGALFGSQFTSSGFTYRVDGLRPGQYQLRVVSYSKYTKVPATKEVSIAVTIPSTPSLTIESPATGSRLQPFNVVGWTMDPNATTGTGIDRVTLSASNGSTTTPIATVTTFGARPDVSSCGTGQFANCGFSVPVSGLTPGTYTLTAAAHSAVDNSTVTKTASFVIPASQSTVTIETPADQAKVDLTFPITGWAIDRGDPIGTGIDVVHIYAYPRSNTGALGSPTFVGAATYGSARTTVGATYGAQFTNSGFSISAATLPAGDYRLVTYAHSIVDGSFTSQNAVDVTVAAPVSDAAMALDMPSTGATLARSFSMAGWALDKGARTGAGVDTIHVYAYPIVNGALTSSPTFVGQATYGTARPDLGAIFGSQFANSGFTLSGTLSYGSYRLIAYAHSTVSGTFNNFRFADVTIPAPVSVPAMAIDTPGAGSTRGSNFAIAGWAVDRGAAAGTGVDAIHVYAFPIVNGTASVDSPIFVGQANYGSTRGDVGAVFGNQFSASGFVLEATLPPGSYRLVAYAHSTVTGTFNDLQGVDVTISLPVPNPAMALDGPREGETVTQPFLTGGWAIDLGATSGIGVDAIHVWAFPIVNGQIGTGVFVDQATLGGARPDVGGVFGSQFNNSGYNFLMNTLAPGEHIIGVYAHSAVSGTFNQVKFVRVTVVR